MSARVHGRAWSGLRLLAGLLLVVGLAGCAGSVAPPVVVTALSGEQRVNLHIADVRTEVGQGVAMTAVDTARITQLVLEDIQALVPGMVDTTAAGRKSVRILITRYDEGSAGARFLMAGLGQIRLDGDVIVTDTVTGQKVAEYKVAKQFSFGGLYGGLTSIQDVEKGFAKSVAALFKPNG